MTKASSEEKARAWELVAAWSDDSSMNWDLIDDEQAADRIRQHIRAVVIPFIRRRATIIRKRRSRRAKR